MYDESAPIVNEQERQNRILTLQPPLQDEDLAYGIARLLAVEVNCLPRDQFESDAHYGEALAFHIEDAFEELDQHSDIVVALGPGSELLATASLNIRDEQSGEVVGVATSSEHRGEGLGQAVMDAIEATARRQGITRLDVIPSKTSLDFYKRLGYGNPQYPEGVHFYKNL